MEDILVPRLIKPLQANLNTRLVDFINRFAKLLFLAELGVIIGLVLNFTHVPGEHVVFVFAIFILTFLLLLQTGLSFIFIFSHMRLAFLGGLTSMTAALICVTHLFLFEQWWGGFIMIFLTVPMVIICLGFMIFYFITGQHRHTTHRKFVYFNILAPFVFAVLLWFTYLIHQQASPNEQEKRRMHNQEEGLREM